MDHLEPPFCQNFEQDFPIQLIVLRQQDPDPFPAARLLFCSRTAAASGHLLPVIRRPFCNGGRNDYGKYAPLADLALHKYLSAHGLYDQTA